MHSVNLKMRLVFSCLLIISLGTQTQALPNTENLWPSSTVFPLSAQMEQLTPVNAQDQLQSSEKPPAHAARIAAEILAGSAGGLGLGLAGAYVTMDLATQKSCDGFCLADQVVIGAIIGMILGNTIGVYIVGKGGNETGAFWATLLGSLLGVAAWIPVIEGNLSDFLLWPVAGSTVATIGFNLTRRYDSPVTSATALINLSDGQMRLAVPTFFFCTDINDKGTFTQRFDVVRMRF